MLFIMIKPDVDSAQVTIPPPLVLLGCNLVVVLLRVFWPAPFLESWVRYVGGFGFLILGLGLFVTSLRLLKLHKTSLPPWKPTHTIIETGPFRVSRNPIYLAFLIFTLGVIFLADQLSGFVVLVPLFVFLDRYVVPMEEAYLSQKFKEPYLEYVERTHRWL